MSNTFDDRDQDTLDTLRPDEFSPPPPPSGCRNFAMGCGCALGCLLLVVVGIGVWVAMNWKTLSADFTKKVAADAVAQSSLAPEDKVRVLNRINQLADDFKDDKVSLEQLGKVMEEIAKSPLLPLGLLMVADEKYLKPSGLSDDDKEAGRRTLQRFARGAFEKSIADGDVKEVMKLLTDRQADGSEKLKERLTDAELEAFLAKAKEKADAADVPDEAFEVNIADELEKAIDKVLKPEQPEADE
ncbi:MAG: hypothetical protein IAG10_32630 [Planctomycetaceae bacterium]|nr:hypothetical protein [Planctomycetaceae bacterium]